MKALLTLAKLLVIASAFTGLSVCGDSFAYSYTFGGGAMATGTFEGTQSGNLITGISNATLVLNGTSYGTVFTASSDYWTHWVSGGEVVSFDGQHNNILFINSDYGAGDYSYSAFFWSITNPSWSEAPWVLTQAGDSTGILGSEGPNSSWSVRQVPDPASTLALLGASFLGLAALRRRFV